MDAESVSLPGDGPVLVNTCIICMEAIAVSEEINTLKCNHIFHKQCLDEWRAGSLGDVNRRCPMCRKALSSFRTVAPRKKKADQQGGGLSSNLNPYSDHSLEPANRSYN